MIEWLYIEVQVINNSKNQFIMILNHFKKKLNREILFVKMWYFRNSQKNQCYDAMRKLP